MKTIMTLLTLFLLSGCGNGQADLHEYVAQIKASKVPFTDIAPEPLKREHVPYSVATLRSPFVRSIRTLDDDGDDLRSDCPQPDLVRQKEHLELYAVDSLEFKGTIEENSIMWALLEAGDGNLYRVGEGAYLGLYHGQVTEIENNLVMVTEWVPDGDGCWLDRNVQLLLAEK